MNENSNKAVRTIAGGIFHSIVTNQSKELSGRDWELLCSHLDIATNTIHCVALIPNGFTVATKTIFLRYIHDNFSIDKRKVEVRFPHQSENIGV